MSGAARWLVRVRNRDPGDACAVWGPLAWYADPLRAREVARDLSRLYRAASVERYRDEPGDPPPEDERAARFYRDGRLVSHRRL